MLRRSFLANTSFFFLSYSPVIKKLKHLKLPLLITRKKDTAVSPDYIVDLHCHPNQKNYLIGAHMYHKHINSKGENDLYMQVDIYKLQTGNVKGLFATHYLPEKGMREQAYTIQTLFPLIKLILPRLAAKLEKGDKSNFDQLKVMINEFESEMAVTNKLLRKELLVVARSYKEFKDYIGNGYIAVAHAIEGSHSLGRQMLPVEYDNHIDWLAERGVCSITLSHFFQNDLSYPVEGLTPHDKKNLTVKWQYTPTNDDKGLTETGKRVVRRMLKKGILIDLTHMTPQGRSDVFTMVEAFNMYNGSYKRPVLFTHTGVRDIVEKYMAPGFDNYKYMSVTNHEIDRIKACDGVIGIIFMNFWLTGSDTHNFKTNAADFENGIPYIIETIKHIKQRTGTYDNIALGSDFDGFADSPADLCNPKDFPKLVACIKEIPGITTADVESIIHGNALRVLEMGWGN